MRDQLTLVPPLRVSVSGSFASSAANMIKGKIACRIRSALAAGESAVIVKERPVRAVGGLFGMNVSDVDPTLRPSTSASVTSASHLMDVTCCVLSPVDRFLSTNDHENVNVLTTYHRRVHAAGCP